MSVGIQIHPMLATDPKVTICAPDVNTARICSCSPQLSSLQSDHIFTLSPNMTKSPTKQLSLRRIAPRTRRTLILSKKRSSNVNDSLSAELAGLRARILAKKNLIIVSGAGIATTAGGEFDKRLW